MEKHGEERDGGGAEEAVICLDPYGAWKRCDVQRYC